MKTQVGTQTVEYFERANKWIWLDDDGETVEVRASLAEIRTLIEAFDKKATETKFDRWEAIRDNGFGLRLVTVTSQADRNTSVWVLDGGKRNKVLMRELIPLTPGNQLRFESWLALRQAISSTEKRAEVIRRELFPRT